MILTSLLNSESFSTYVEKWSLKAHFLDYLFQNWYRFWCLGQYVISSLAFHTAIDPVVGKIYIYACLYRILYLMLGYMIWYNIFKILEILDMILYPILAKISISYLCLSWSFMHSCVNQSQRVFLVFFMKFYSLYMLSSILCDTWTSQFINFLEMLRCFMQKNSRIVRSNFSYLTQDQLPRLQIQHW